MTLGHLIYEATQTLSTSTARLDAELLAAKILNCSREKLYTVWNKVLVLKEIQQIKKLLNKRKKGIPIAYLLEEKEFYGQVFKIKSPVFIPRPDTECLVSAVLSQESKNEKLTIVDLGTGSGCVGLSLLKYMQNSNLVAVDKDPSAVQLSQWNAHRLGLANRSFFLNKDVAHLQKSDWRKFSKGKILIVANPPYIALDDSQVQMEVVNSEPSLALFSDNGGFKHIYSWLTVAQNLLDLGGYYFFEIGAGQSHQFCVGQKIDNMCCINRFKDLSRNIRVVQFKKI